MSTVISIFHIKNSKTEPTWIFSNKKSFRLSNRQKLALCKTGGLFNRNKAYNRVFTAERLQYYLSALNNILAGWQPCFAYHQVHAGYFQYHRNN